VCCHNVRYRVGNIATETIEAIWRGEKLQRLRNALARYDMRSGCRFCDWRISGGHFASLTMTTYDRFPVEEAVPVWPQMMEFSMTNSCNLECVMCTGQASSAIRARRERLPPLPRAYGEAFFIELQRFLPHLKRAKFLGGEPFLQPECFRIWDLMIGLDLRTPCHVTTNGTQWNAKIERVLEMLPVNISISMDGISRQTVEAIRFGASYDVIMQNFRSFHSYARANNTVLSLTFCLMRQNWHELGEFCVFADKWDCLVFVNTVRTPAAHSLYTLSPPELKLILASMEKESSTLLPKLRGNLSVWVDEFERLRAFVRRGQTKNSRRYPTP